ncbi:MAG: hypothetical protein DHS20C14_06890 [Phycisphaeraceae bacterium]|nr:MAG: hypothetical protein DHS20C14_06890 [Phycisphaeraceae bacterium]
MNLDQTAVALANSFDSSGAEAQGVIHEVAMRAACGLKTILVVGPSRHRAAIDARRADEMGPLADPSARAIVLNSGATEAAAWASRALAAAGVAVAQLDPRKAAPVTSGHTLDARPRHVDSRWFERTLGKVDVVVVPGGVGVDEDRRPTTLGETGAALSAVFLADALALELVVEGDGATPALDQVPGRKAKLLARDRGVTVRVALAPTVQAGRFVPGPLASMSARAVSA